MRRSVSLLLILSLPAALRAQEKAAPALSAVAQARLLWEESSKYVLQSAEDMPADKYSFRPTPSVRTFGEVIGHVAGSQRMFCALALGEKPPAEDAVEKASTTKAQLVQAMRESNDYCARAYAQTDAAVRPMVDLFGAQRSRLYVLMSNTGHDQEHYGNLVTYLRINGLVPPSSKPR